MGKCPHSVFGDLFPVVFARQHLSELSLIFGLNKRWHFNAGDRAFKSKKRRDALRDSGDLVARARGLYLEQRWDSRTHKQAVPAVCDTLTLRRRRVNDWAAKFGWERAVCVMKLFMKDDIC